MLRSCFKGDELQALQRVGLAMVKSVVAMNVTLLTTDKTIHYPHWTLGYYNIKVIKKKKKEELPPRFSVMTSFPQIS